MSSDRRNRRLLLEPSLVMLLLLIPVGWLAVVTVFVAVCQAAARAEAPAVPAEADPPEVVSEGLVVWDRAAAEMLRAKYAGRCQQARVRRKLQAPPVRRARRIAAHGIR
jgi:hypothetical protein